jgi:hypothetical protein
LFTPVLRQIIPYGMLNFSFTIPTPEIRLKQAGRGGIGTLLRQKKRAGYCGKDPKSVRKPEQCGGSACHLWSAVNGSTRR